MSSTTNAVASLNSISYYFSISTGFFVFLFGVIGNILNIIVFLSLKTFRKNPCAFCLLILSISNNGVILFSTVPSLLTGIFKNYNGINAIFSCKIAITSGQTFGLISHCVMCLAAIDQCLSTSTNARVKGMSINLIRRLILICTSLCILHGIPVLIYYDAQILPQTNVTTCRLNDNNGPYSKYWMYVGLPILGGFLPIFIMSIFGLIALRNVRQMTKRNVHIIRLRLEQQLTAMVLIKVFSVSATVVPFLVAYIILYTTSLHSNDFSAQIISVLINRVFTFLLFINYADSFYIFFGSSARFRRQLKFVLFDVYLKRWRVKRDVNRIQPTGESFILSINSNHHHPRE